jgi:alkylhydroperoxidase/carboxymuconolactone decarboxylase family protein YurZ
MAGATPEETLRGLALGQGAVADQVLSMQVDALTKSGLDKKSFVMARLGALVAQGAGQLSYMQTLEVAEEWGVTRDEIVGALIALAPTVGSARILAAAPLVAAALGVVESD